MTLSYIFRNLWARRLTTLLTAGGMALVVYVFATVLMLEAGLRETLQETGAPDNVVVIRKSSQTEVQSGVERSQAAIVESRGEIAYDGLGQRMVSKELVVLITLLKSADKAPANVVIRGTTAQGLALRPQAKLLAGRLFRAGTAEIVVGRAIAERFSGVGLGERLKFGQREWTIVGVIDAGRTGFNSEIWGDADQMRQAFRRPVYSSVTFRLADTGSFDKLKQELESDPRLTIEAKRETVYYAEQSEVMAKFIRILGMVLSVIFSLGAIIGAMITMYASVASRTAEIGTLRALGFPRRRILAAFLIEAVLLGLAGGAAGLALASTMQFLTLSTMNWQTFSELAFSFTLTPAIVVQSLAFAVLMGLLGGFLPALRAARLNIVEALRAA
ncbi:MAG: ABC transporter permease [Sulfuricella sp.]|nr:ABC transporter permease [Sulfuricella sp.]